MRTVKRMEKTSIIKDWTMNRLEGETIERKIERIKNNREGITEGANLMYSERGDGQDPMTDVRTDKWLIAIDQLNERTQKYRLSREERNKKAKEAPKDEDVKITGTEPGESGNPSQ